MKNSNNNNNNKVMLLLLLLRSVTQRMQFRNRVTLNWTGCSEMPQSSSSTHHISFKVYHIYLLFSIPFCDTHCIKERVSYIYIQLAFFFSNASIAPHPNHQHKVYIYKDFHHCTHTHARCNLACFSYCIYLLHICNN